MSPTVHPGRLLRRELQARGSSANRLALERGRARRLGNGARFGKDLQAQHDIARVERDHGEEIARRVRPADAA